MGACSFVNTGRGKTMREAYDTLCSNAEEEYGHQDGYNGTISTTHGFRDVTDLYMSSKKDYRGFIDEKLEGLSKRECWGICLKKPVTNNNKIKSTVEHHVLKGTRKWELKYVVYDWKDSIGSFNTKTEAVKKAREHTEKTGRTTEIKVEKRSTADVKVATIKYKKSDKEALGEYIFFGYAAE